MGGVPRVAGQVDGGGMEAPDQPEVCVVSPRITHLIWHRRARRGRRPAAVSWRDHAERHRRRRVPSSGWPRVGVPSGVGRCRASRSRWRRPVRCACLMSVLGAGRGPAVSCGSLRHASLGLAPACPSPGLVRAGPGRSGVPPAGAAPRHGAEPYASGRVRGARMRGDGDVSGGLSSSPIP